MSLLDELSNLDDGVSRGERCSIAVLLSSLTADEVAALNAAFADRNVTSSAISRALGRAGHRISPVTVGRHRRRGTASGCRCDA